MIEASHAIGADSLRGRPGAAMSQQQKGIAKEGLTHVSKEDLLAEPNFDLETMSGSSTGKIETAAAIQQPIPRVMFVVDSSGSMGQLMGNRKTKIYILKKLLSRYLTSQWTAKSSSGLRVFGSRRERDCSDNYLAIVPGESKLGTIEGAVKGLEPVGMTPLSAALSDAYRDIKDYSGPKRVVLFTDGEETCGRDPCQIIQEIRAADITFKLFIVALGLKDQNETLDKLKCLGDVSLADNEEELENLLNNLNNELNPNKNLKVVSPDPRATVFLYRADNKKEMFRKFEAQLGIEVPPGRYVAVVELSPRFIFQDVIIPPDKVVTLTVAGNGQYIATFFDQLLDIELRNKDNKIVKKFKTDVWTELPTGRWNLRFHRLPYYEKVVENYLVVPNGRYEESVDDAGVVIVREPKVRGVYVFNARGGSIGNYLTNFPFVLPKGLYEIKVSNECSFREVTVDSKKELQVLDCGVKK